MKNRQDLLKSFANRTAEELLGSESRRVMRSLRLAGLLRAEPPAAPAKSSSYRATQAERVGIWERKKGAGSQAFVRRMEMMPDWNLWASVSAIEPRRARQRVVLLGESVARGYLYDPQFTPAMVLEKIFGSHSGPGELEVIDLARTNLKFEIRQLGQEALLLQPDALVIFAGNNWNVHFGNTARMAAMETVLRDEGVPGLKKLIEQWLVADVSSLVNEISGTYAGQRIPIVWLIPEFNLLDWKDPAVNAPHLPGEGNRQWMICFERAKQSLAEGDTASAYEFGTRMFELDHGVNAAAAYILGQCSYRDGDMEAARLWLERARDASIWDVSRVISPRAYSVTQQTLREQVRKYPNNAIVDLPALFKEYLGTDLPDRRLFLDFCHLTAEGIGIAMAATASALLPRLQRQNAAWRSLAQRAVQPADHVKAEAFFLAAIHNAHFYQPYDLVLHWCRQALKSSRNIAGLMEQFIELQTQRSPMLMCKVAEQIAGTGSPLIQNYLLRKNHQQLDLVLLQAIVASFQEVGIDLNDRLARLRLEEHSAAAEGRNLLDYYYCSGGGQPQEVMWVMPGHVEAKRSKQTDYYRAYWPQSKFKFIGESTVPLLLSMTLRVPNSSGESASVEVNGIRACVIPVSSRWETWDITIPPGMVRNGINDVTIAWPASIQNNEFEIFVESLNELPEGSLPEFFPVFGEIHSFNVSSAAAGKMQGETGSENPGTILRSRSVEASR